MTIFDTSHVAYSLTGASTTSTIVTGDYGDDNQYSTLTKARLRFVTKPTTATGTNYYKSVSGDSVTTGTTSTMSDGKFDFLVSSRWHRVSFTFTGDVVTDGIYLELPANGTS